MMTTMTSADQQIRDAVIRHLAWEPGLDASIIVVSTRAGVVTLSGTVDSEATRQKALADARSVEGVKQVVDKLTVKKK